MAGASGGATGRLGSIRPKPDLTLGGAQKPKFKPKVPARRKAKEVKTEGDDIKAEGSESGRGGRGSGRGQSARGRGRRAQPQSQTVFGAGSFVKPAKKPPRPPGSGGGGGGGGTSPRAEKAANDRKAEQERIDAAPVDFAEGWDESPRSKRSSSKSKGAGSDPSVKREEGDEALLDHVSSEEDDFEQYLLRPICIATLCSFVCVRSLSL